MNFLLMRLAASGKSHTSVCLRCKTDYYNFEVNSECGKINLARTRYTFFYWWLVRVTLVVDLLFCPKILG